MILPPPPRSAHELVVFLVDAAVTHQPWLAAGVDRVVTGARRSLAAPNHHFAWVLFDSTIRAVHPEEVAVSGTAIVTTARRLLPVNPAPTALDGGLAAAYDLARSFLDRRDDGLPRAVDLLAVVGPGGDCGGEEHAAIASDPRIQLAVVTYGGPGPTPAGLDVTALPDPPDDPDLGSAWIAARCRTAGRRRPCLVLG
ncbi:hypothetical protein [Micromonospora sp. NBC_01638]|uniref:hypothetical protein n=1 Tax=Micromonospora sp. NBC_01638 TaxID=2975982 RepID=UPI00386B1E9D|nr:hypothetical protein OG811_13920 [Micromonospora sp. NBC_01638]